MIHEKFIEIITTKILNSRFKENYENDMAAHGICFGFYYRLKPSQIVQNGLTAAADTRFADSIRLFLTKKSLKE